MREIRFRAWHKEEKWMKLVRVLGLDFLIPKSEYTAFEREIPMSEVNLMQFTGLKDSKGVDIFEGDIVKHTGSIPYISHVVYGVNDRLNQEACFYFQIEHGPKAQFTSKDHEVIGNRFEHPELLEK